jgi:hypothetical protein
MPDLGLLGTGLSLSALPEDVTQALNLSLALTIDSRMSTIDSVFQVGCLPWRKHTRSPTISCRCSMGEWKQMTEAVVRVMWPTAEVVR